MGKGGVPIFGAILVFAFLILAVVAGGLPPTVLIMALVAVLVVAGVMAVKYFSD
jgi:hypothetical protein